MTLTDNIGEEWYGVLGHLFDTEWMQTIMRRAAVLGDRLRPEPCNVFNAYRSTPPSKVKVVIMGQDPYPGKQAHGLSFSSITNTPPSLRIIFKELERSGYGVRTNPDLQDWADQGVFLLNSVLTTTAGIPNAHKDWNWQIFTQATLQHLNTRTEQPIVFLSWGNYAKELVNANRLAGPNGTDHPRRFYLDACHPQAENYSGGKLKFVGCEHFSLANTFLQNCGASPIKWV